MAKKRRSKRVVKKIEIVSVLLLFVSIALLLVCGFLKDNGFGDFWWPAVGIIGFFSCDFLALFLLCRVLPDALLYDAEKKSKQYDALNLSRLENMSAKHIREKLLEHKFEETEGGYLRKKIFTFLKDSICYYVRSTASIDLKSTVDQEMKVIDKIDEKSKNLCFLLFIYKNDLCESDYQTLREISKVFILNETVVPVSYCHTSVIVLIDNETGEGQFLDINSRRSISVYAYGCRLIKKYFSR